MFDTADTESSGDGRACVAGGEPRDTHAGLRLRPQPPFVAALQGDGTRASRCRALRALSLRGQGHRETILIALLTALGDRDLEVRIAALDGLHRLACDSPRLGERVIGVLRQAALAPSRSTAMHAAALCAAHERAHGVSQS